MIRRALAVAVLLAAALGTPAAATAAVSCAPVTAQGRTAPVLREPTQRLKPKAYTFRLRTNCGVITIVADAKRAPITVRNLAFLASKKYFDNTLCHRLTTAGINVLQCGDPTATGTGGPGFAYADENLPTTIKTNRYPAGTVAMANAGPNTNGSQFFLVYKNGTFDLPPSYTIWGRITGGLNILKAIAAKGVEGGGADGRPTQAIAVLSVTVSEGTP